MGWGEAEHRDSPDGTPPVVWEQIGPDYWETYIGDYEIAFFHWHDHDSVHVVYGLTESAAWEGCIRYSEEEEDWPDEKVEDMKQNIQSLLMQQFL